MVSKIPAPLSNLRLKPAGLRWPWKRGPGWFYGTSDNLFCRFRHSSRPEDSKGVRGFWKKISKEARWCAEIFDWFCGFWVHFFWDLEFRVNLPGFSEFWWILLTFSNAAGEQAALPKRMKKVIQKVHFFSIFFIFFSIFFSKLSKTGAKNVKKWTPPFFSTQIADVSLYINLLVFGRCFW